MKKNSITTTQISDGNALSVSLLNYGARIAQIHYGEHSLALTYANTQDYLTDPYYLGATIGPITNRIANGRITIGDEIFQMPSNEGQHCLHSGGIGFDKEFWTLTQATNSMVEYELEFNLSKVGLRGLLKTTAQYRVAEGALSVVYTSESDTATYINLTNHVYLNLSGHSARIDDHEFELFSESFVRVDESNVPTGALTLLEKPFKYNVSRESEIAEFTGLIDHHFNSDRCKMVLAKSLTSAVQLEVSSNSPGFQFYTGQNLGLPFTSGAGFCVETQLAPDAINQATFYSPILKKDDKRIQKTVFKFSI